MTIDISNLSQEKRVFLKTHPDFLRGFEKEIIKQAQKIQARRETRSKGKSKLQRDLEDVDRRVEEAKGRAERLRLERLLNLPFYLRGDFSGDSVQGKKALICPVCGDSDKGSKMSGKPWCFKCNSPLMAKDKVEKWKKMAKILRKYRLKDEFKRRGLDF